MKLEMMRAIGEFGDVDFTGYIPSGKHTKRY
jgi:hypothetical protein